MRLDDFATRKLKSLSRRRLDRQLTVTERGATQAISNDGDELISFACNDYLGLSRDPRVVAASLEATRRYGVGAGASRLISGNHPLYTRLESQLAEIKGTEAAIVFGSGYLANIGVIPVLSGAPDLILVDELCHSCLLTGARLSGSHVMSFRHNDIAHLAALLADEREQHRNCLVLTDGVFSMGGNLAPLAKLGGLCARHGAWLMTDDAHGLGVVGAGRGSTFAAGADAQVPLQMGTLSKAVGAYGGYLCASRVVVELLQNRARSFVYSTGLPPGVVAAASAALDIIRTEKALVDKPLAHAQRFAAAQQLPRAESAIVPLFLGAAEPALALSRRLRTEGFFVPAIRPPTVATGTSRLRFAFSALHSSADIERLSTSLTRLRAGS